MDTTNTRGGLAPVAPVAPVAPSDSSVSTPADREKLVEVEWTDPEGKVHAGIFTLQAIDEQREKLTRARIKANLANVPWEHIEPDVRVHIDCIATVMLGVKDAPSWFPLNVTGLTRADEGLVAALALEVVRHTADYFRERQAAYRGAPEQPRFSIRAVAAPTRH